MGLVESMRHQRFRHETVILARDSGTLVYVRSRFPLELAAKIEAERRLDAHVPSMAEVIRQLCSEALAIRRIGRSKPKRGALVPFVGLVSGKRSKSAKPEIKNT